MLQNAGVIFTRMAADIDEESIKTGMHKPLDVAARLAELKAGHVSGQRPGAWVIGCDQVLEFGGRLISKPASIPDARQQLLDLRGQKHRLISSVVLMRNGTVVWHFSGQATLWMRQFSDSFLTAYLVKNRADLLQTVGCYKLESDGVRLFSKIDGDYFTILGMPLIELLDQLAKLGVIEK